MLDGELKDWKSTLEVDARDKVVDECVGWAYYLSVLSELEEMNQCSNFKWIKF